MGETLFHYLKGVDSMNTRGQYQTLDRSLLTAALIFPIVERAILDHPAPPPHLGQIMELAHELIERLLFAFPPFPTPSAPRSPCHHLFAIPPHPSEQATLLSRTNSQATPFSLSTYFPELRALSHPSLKFTNRGRRPSKGQLLSPKGESL